MSRRPTRTCVAGRDDGMKTAKWLMKRAERTDQQTVFLLNLLQEHRLEIEARDTVMRESSKLISNLQSENEALKHQLMDRLPNGREAITAGAKVFRQREPRNPLVAASQVAGCIPRAQATSLPIGCDVSPAQGSDFSFSTRGCCTDARSIPSSACSTVHDAWVCVLAPSQANASSEQQSEKLSQAAHANSIRELALPFTKPCSNRPAPHTLQAPEQAVGASIAQLATVAYPRPKMKVLENSTCVRAVLPQEQQPEPRQPSFEPIQHSKKLGNEELLEQLKARCASLMMEVDSLRVQLQHQHQEAEQAEVRQAQTQPPPPQHQAPEYPSKQLRGICTSPAAQEVQSLRSALEAAQCAVAASMDKYLTCKKDLDVLTHKYESLMTQKLVVEEDRNRLQSPSMDIALLRFKLPAVDSAMCDLEERLQEMEELLDSNRVEAEDAVRSHHEHRQRWAQKYEGMRAKLAGAEAKLAAAGLFGIAGQVENAAGVEETQKTGGKQRQVEEVSLGGWVTEFEFGGGCGTRWRAASGDGACVLAGSATGYHQLAALSSV